MHWRCRTSVRPASSAPFSHSDEASGLAGRRHPQSTGQHESLNVLRRLQEAPVACSDAGFFRHGPRICDCEVLPAARGLALGWADAAGVDGGTELPGEPAAGCDAPKNIKFRFQFMQVGNFRIGA
ncbi:unnamed protein product [Symbiodinium sp. CCMP2592]|nr:unnamed protein product [Symbiodinium sp. CCMP2592]